MNRTAGVMLALFSTTMLWGAQQTLNFQGMTATYSGNGYMRLGPMPADYVYSLIITEGSELSEKPETLRIRPRTANARNEVYIDSIYSEVPLNIIATLPPGVTIPNYIRNIYIDGNSALINIVGGTLGAGDAQDGRVIIEGALGTLKVSGKKFNVPNTTTTEWWGGDIWADVYVADNVKRIYTLGGNLHYDNHGGILGTVSIDGGLDALILNGYVVKGDRSVPTSQKMFGGSMNTVLDVDDNIIKMMLLKGGTMLGGEITCLQLAKLQIKGQKSTSPPRDVPLSGQGMFNVAITAKDVGGDGKYSKLNNLMIQNGSWRDTRIANKGRIGALKVTGETVGGMGQVSNVIVRAGYTGSLTANQAPSLWADVVSTSIYAGNTLVLPFGIGTTDTGELLSVRIHFRDTALNALLSNDVGQVFMGTNRWVFEHAPTNCYFVWATTNAQLGVASNITIRVHDFGIPYKYDDLQLVVTVTTNVIPPKLVLDPPDNPRYYLTNSQPFLFWSASVAQPGLHGPLVYSVEGISAIQLGIVATNLSDKTGYYFTPTQPAPGTYSNIVFRVSNGVFSDAASITLHVITSNTITLASSLPGNQCTRAINTAFDFTLDASRPNAALPRITAHNLPPNATLHAEEVRDDMVRYRVVWIPRHGDAGVWHVDFEVHDEDNTRQAALAVTLTVRDQTAREPVAPTTAAAVLLAEGSYDGDINSLNVVGSMHDSSFIASTTDKAANVWSNAIYISRLKSLRIDGVAQSNTFVSLKRINIANGTAFDFVNNFVWINGTRAAGSTP
jgi:hypothetical protein